MASTVLMSCSPLLPAKLASLQRPSRSFQTTLFSGFSAQRRSGRSNAVVACSTEKMGMQWGHANASLSYVGDTEVMAKKTDTLSQFLPALLPFVVAFTALAALSYPSSFNWVSNELYPPALGSIMLSIGIQLSVNDFALAFKRPLPVSVGFLAHYVLKPLMGVLVANAFGISPTFYYGFVLISCVPGAQLSSYASLLSKGDVALSILLTSFTTIASVISTPLLSRLLLGSVVPVDAIAMSKSILQVGLVPVTLGLVLNTYAKLVVSLLRPMMPFVGMVCTSLCIGGPLSINQRQVLSADGLGLIIPVVTVHAVSFDYWFSRIPALKQEEEVSRTISLYTGMQNATLAGLLATQFLGSSQAVAPACSVVVSAIMGLCLASFWGNGFRIRDIPSLIITPQNSGSTAEA